jgi:dolichol-phosphate mannosyltransferase
MRSVVVIPTYNEAATIERTLYEVLARPARVDVLVVDDNSPDGTGDLVERRAAALDGRVRVLRRPRKCGLGRAYVDGFEHALAAGYDAVLQMDADGSHPAEAIDRLLHVLEDHDVAIGSRYVKGGSSEGLSRQRELLSRAGSGYARFVLGTSVRDLTTGLKAWRSDALRTINLGSVLSDGFAFQIELTVLAERQHLRVVEIPISFAERRAGRSKLNLRVVAEAIALVPWLAIRPRKLQPAAKPQRPSHAGR